MSTPFNFGTTLRPTGLASPAPATATPATSVASPAAIKATTTTTKAPTKITPNAAPSSTMTYGLLEESVDQWMREMGDLERSFIDQATGVNARDHALMMSAERVSQLSSQVQRAQLDQRQLGQKLEYMAAQQEELERLLAPLEAAMKRAPGLSVQQHADLQREDTYLMAEDIYSQLSSVSQNVRNLTAQLNAANASVVQDEPLQQLSKVLSSHMDALAWVQQKAGLLQQKLRKIDSDCQQQRTKPPLKR